VLCPGTKFHWRSSERRIRVSCSRGKHRGAVQLRLEAMWVCYRQAVRAARCGAPYAPRGAMKNPVMSPRGAGSEGTPRGIQSIKSQRRRTSTEDGAMRAATICTCLAAVVTVSGCAGGSSSGGAPPAVSPSGPSSLSSPPSTPTYQIGGTVSGLTGNGLVLALNGGQSLSVEADGNFVFPQGVASGTSYTVTVSTQPNVPRELCAVSTGSGVVGTANVRAIQVNCSAVIGFLYVLAN
jgi:hypothetical protein